MEEKIRVGIPSYDESKLDCTTYNPEVLNVVNLISEPLLRMYDGKIWPALARSWQVFQKGCRWLFYIPQNTLFNDSTPCTVADVVESINYMKETADDRGHQSSYARYLKDVTFNILNRYALEVVCPKPCGDIAEILSSIPVLKPNRLGKRIVGTGSYKYSNYWANKSIRLNKLSGLKYLSAYKQITFFVEPDPQKRLEMLRKGDVHIVSGMNDIPREERNDGNFWWECRQNQSVMGMLNGYRAPFNDPVARRAVNLAVDVKHIIATLLDGHASPAASVVSPYHCGCSSLLDPIPYDPDEARRLFSQVDTAEEVVVTAAAGCPRESFALADMIAQYLADVGLKVRVERYDDADAYYEKVSAGNLADIMLMHTMNSSTYRLLRDTIDCEEPGPMWQGVRDAEVQRLIHEANVECDITDRERRYAKAIAYLNRNPHWLYLYHPSGVFASHPDVTDVETLHSGVFRFPGAW